MTPQEAKTIAEFLIGNLQHEISITETVFQAVPTDTLEFRPDPKSRSAIGLLRHITLEDEWLLNSVADGHVPPPPDDSDACGLMTPAEAIARYRERIPAAIARVQALPGEALLKPIDFLGMMTLPALQILSMTLRHSAHHRGQLSSYLRAMGGKVPGIYGPSADTVMAAGA
jgi:uncharacterized damage-inducible protein DinB